MAKKPPSVNPFAHLADCSTDPAHISQSLEKVVKAGENLEQAHGDLFPLTIQLTDLLAECPAAETDAVAGETRRGEEIGGQLSQIAEAIRTGDFDQLGAADQLLWAAFQNGTFNRYPVLQYAANHFCRLVFDGGGATDLPVGLTYELLHCLGAYTLPGFPLEPPYGDEGNWYVAGVRELARLLAAERKPLSARRRPMIPRAPRKSRGRRPGESTPGAQPDTRLRKR